MKFNIFVHPMAMAGIVVAQDVHAVDHQEVVNKVQTDWSQGDLIPILNRFIKSTVRQSYFDGKTNKSADYQQQSDILKKEIVFEKTKSDNINSYLRLRYSSLTCKQKEAVRAQKTRARNFLNNILKKGLVTQKDRIHPPACRIVQCFKCRKIETTKKFTGKMLPSKCFRDGLSTRLIRNYKERDGYCNGLSSLFLKKMLENQHHDFTETLLQVQKASFSTVTPYSRQLIHAIIAHHMHQGEGFLARQIDKNIKQEWGGGYYLNDQSLIPKLQNLSDRYPKKTIGFLIGIRLSEVTFTRPENRNKIIKINCEKGDQQDSDINSQTDDWKDVESCGHRVGVIKHSNGSFLLYDPNQKEGPLRGNLQDVLNRMCTRPAMYESYIYELHTFFPLQSKKEIQVYEENKLKYFCEPRASRCDIRSELLDPQVNIVWFDMFKRHIWSSDTMLSAVKILVAHGPFVRKQLKDLTKDLQGENKEPRKRYVSVEQVSHALENMNIEQFDTSINFKEGHKLLGLMLAEYIENVWSTVPMYEEEYHRKEFLERICENIHSMVKTCEDYVAMDRIPSNESVMFNAKGKLGLGVFEHSVVAVVNIYCAKICPGEKITLTSKYKDFNTMKLSDDFDNPKP